MTSAEFENIYHTYFSAVYQYVLGLCNNQHIAEEIVSETFFKAMHGIDRFRGECGISSWLCQIAKNSYYSYLRKNKNVDNTDSLDKWTDEEDRCAEEELVQKENVMQIHAVLHTMAEPYKEVFMLRVFGELSFRQIGEIFNKTENWACVTYYRARKKIQEEMEGKA